MAHRWADFTVPVVDAARNRTLAHCRDGSRLDTLRPIKDIRISWAGGFKLLWPPALSVHRDTWGENVGQVGNLSYGRAVHPRAYEENNLAKAPSLRKGKRCIGSPPRVRGKLVDGFTDDAVVAWQL